jgi:hypothetical protein
MMSGAVPMIGTEIVSASIRLIWIAGATSAAAGAGSALAVLLRVVAAM